LEVVLLSSRFLPPFTGSRITAFGCLQALLDQLHCHVVSDESAEKLHEPHQYGLDGFGGRGVAVRHYALRDPVDVGLGPGAELNLPQCGVLSLRLRERAREEGVTAFGTDPPRKRTIQIVARLSGGARGGGALRSPRRVTLDQAVRELSRRRLVLRQRLSTHGRMALTRRFATISGTEQDLFAAL
jgi:hypothetical protein